MRQSRQPAFYAVVGVPDTLDGRFELLSLHVFLVLQRLKKDGPDGTATAQALVDRMFANMDESLREMGVGDLGVGRRVKQMASAFYGRVAAYESGLGGTGEALGAALGRNLFGTTQPTAEQLRQMGGYLRRAVGVLEAQASPSLLAGELTFEPPLT